MVEDVVEGKVALAAGGGCDGGHPSDPMLDRAIQVRLGNHLRAMYDGLMKEPIPPHLLELLDRTDKPPDVR